MGGDVRNTGDKAFQSTRPVRGATVMFSLMFLASIVSIHAPREGRDVLRTAAQTVALLVSIHAPREGRDVGRDGSAHWSDGFQSTRPVRGATCVASRLSTSIQMFQSTRPVRGATGINTRLDTHEAVSIHAPREGRDEQTVTELFATLRVSIHAPREGRDVQTSCK